MIPHNHYASAAALVTNSQGEVLLVRSPLRGWEFPGGMIEPHESITDGLLREIREESGVSVKILSYVGVCQNLISDSVNHDFRCSYVSGELTPSDESTEVGWFSPDEAMNIIGSPLTRLRLSHMLSENPIVYLFSFEKYTDEDGVMHFDMKQETELPSYPDGSVQ